MSLYHTWKRDENSFPQHEPNKLLTNWCTNPDSSWVDAGSVDDREPRQLPVDNSLFRPQLLRSKRRKNISSMLSFHNTAKPLCVPADRPTGWGPLPGSAVPPSAFVCFDGKSGESCRPELFPAASLQHGSHWAQAAPFTHKVNTKTLSFKFQKTCWRSSLIWSTDRSEQEGIHTYRFTYAVHLFGSWLLLFFLFLVFFFPQAPERLASASFPQNGRV